MSLQEDYQAGAVLAKRLMRLGERERDTVSAVSPSCEILLKPLLLGRLLQLCELSQTYCLDRLPWSPESAPADKAKTLFSVTAFRTLLLINLN